MTTNKLSPGHYHVDGFCALLAGRTWIVKREGCQAEGTDNPNERPAYRTSLNMVRDYVSCEQVMTKNKFVGREITVDGKVGTIIYANSVEVLIQFDDNSRTRLAKDRAAFILLVKVLR